MTTATRKNQIKIKNQNLFQRAKQWLCICVMIYYGTGTFLCRPLQNNNIKSFNVRFYSKLEHMLIINFPFIFSNLKPPLDDLLGQCHKIWHNSPSHSQECHMAQEVIICTKLGQSVQNLDVHQTDLHIGSIKSYLPPPPPLPTYMRHNQPPLHFW